MYNGNLTRYILYLESKEFCDRPIYNYIHKFNYFYWLSYFFVSAFSRIFTTYGNKCI